MRTFWSKLAVTLGKRAGVVALAGLLVTMVLGFGLTRLDFATGQDSYLNADEQIAKDNEAYQSLFGGQIMLTLLVLDDDLTLPELVTGENREVFDAVTEELCGEIVDGICTANPTIRSVVSPITALELADNLIRRDYDDPTQLAALPTQSIAGTVLGQALEDAQEGSEEWEARLVDQNRTACRLLGLDSNPLLNTPEELRETCDEPGFATGPGQVTVDPELANLDNPDWVDFLLHDNQGEIRRSLATFFPSEGHATMIVRLTGNASLEVEGEGAEAVKAAWAPHEIDGAEITVTGAPVLLKDLNDYLRGGLLMLGGAAVVAMAIVLILLFDVRWRLLPLGIIVVGCIWTFGIAGYVGIPLSVVTIAGLPVLLGMGIDYSIQLHARVEEEVIIDRADHPIQESTRQLGPPLVAVTVVAIVSFISLQVARTPMIRDFGLLLAIGIAVTLVCSIIVNVSTLGFREYRNPSQGRDYRSGALGRLVVRLGSLPPASALVLVGLAVALFAGGLAVDGRLQLQTDVVQWVNQDTQNRRDVATLHDEVDTSSELGTYVLAPTWDELFSDETIVWVHDYTEEQLTLFPEALKRASSILTPISYLLEVPPLDADPDGSTEPFRTAPTGEQVRKTYEAAPEAVRAFTVSADLDQPALNVLHTTRPGELSQLAEVVDHIEATANPPGEVRATPSGLAVVGVGLLQNLESGRAELTYLALGLVLLFLVVRLRSIVRGVLCLVPVVMATGATSLVAFALDLKLSPMTAVGGPIVIAVCAEFTTLLLLRFLEERQRGLNPKAAADVAASRTGRAFIVSALTGVVGIGVIATSSLPILRDFGIIVAMNVSVALLSALVVLPPMLIWADERRWVSRGWVPDDVLDRATKSEDETVSRVPDLGGSGGIPGYKEPSERT